MNHILVVGSIGYDTITTPKGKRERTLGGSANYFSLAASLYAPVRVVGVVGEDYEPQHREWLQQRKVDLTGLQTVPGQTFAWEGKYENAMNEAITLSTHLNVFEKFQPTIPAPYRQSEVVFLANIDPVLQMQVLEQTQSPKLVAADTMNYWISSKRNEVLKVLENTDILLINETEIRDLTKSWNTIKAVKEVMHMGPRAVVVKRGEYGFILFTESRYYILPAFPIDEVVDPTGAGDTFAGGFLGFLSQLKDTHNRDDLKKACVHGCLLASFTVQDFGVEGLLHLQKAQLEERIKHYSEVIA